MKFVLKLLLFLLLAAGLMAAHNLYLHQTVLIRFGGIDVEPNLSTLLIVFLLLTLVLYALIRAVLFLIFLPTHVREWRRRRLGQKQDRLLEQSLRAMALGDEVAAERNLSLLAGAGAASAEAYLLAAVSARRQGAKQRELTLLQKAVAGNGDPNSPTRRVAQGCLALAGDKPAEGLNEFRPVAGSRPTPRIPHDTHAECSERLDDRNAALMSRIAIAKLSSPPDPGALKDALASLERLGDRALIADIYKEEQSGLAKESQGFAACIARRLSYAEMNAEADAALKKHVKNGPIPDVLETAAEVGSEPLVDSAIEAAERIGKEGKNAALLRALGRLYMRKQLWKKARESLDAALTSDPQPETHEALAAMLQASGGAPDEIIAQYRLAEASRRNGAKAVIG